MTLIGMIEDSLVLRKNLEKMFEYDREMELIFSVPSIEQVISQPAYQKVHPDVLLLDIELPGISGLDAIPRLRKMFPGTAIMVITGNTDEEVIWKATVGGAKGYLLKPVSYSEMRDHILHIKEGNTIISPEAANSLVRKLNVMVEDRKPEFDHMLTKKENEVVEYFLRGFTYKQIAMCMQISVSTVNDHQKKIYKKLNITSKYELMAKLLPN